MSTKRSRGCERRRRNKDRPPSFLPRISKSKLFLSKLFQTILWWFCVISKGYKTSKPHLVASKFFRRCRLLSAHSRCLPTAFRHSAPYGLERARPFAGVCVVKGNGRVHGGGVIRIERILNLARSQIIRKEMSIFLPRDSATILSRGEMSGADPCATGYQDCAPGRRAEPIRAHPKRSRPFPSPQSPPVAIMTPPNSCSRHKETLREVSRIVLCRDSKCGLGGFQWANKVSKLTPWMQKWGIMP